MALARHLAAIVTLVCIASCSFRLVREASLNEPAVKRIIYATARTRGLALKRKIAVELVDRETARRHLVVEMQRSLPPEKLRVQERLLKKLGAIPRDMDLGALLLELLSEQVAGYYDPETKLLRLVDPSEGVGVAMRAIENLLQKDLTGEFLLAHEATHAIDDQHFDLKRFGEVSGNTDAQAARTAYAEGVAMLTAFHTTLGLRMRRVAFHVAGELSLTEEPASVLNRTPAIIKRELLFPYVEGMRFASAVYQSGGTRALDEAYRDPPESSEQVLHPEKYLGSVRDRPVPVTVATDLSALRSLQRVDEDTMGEHGILALFEEPLGYVAASKAAAGWGGDRYVVYEDAASQDVGLYWRTIWDTPRDRDEFKVAVKRAITFRYGSADEDSDVARWKTPDGIYELWVEGRLGVNVAVVPIGMPVRAQ